MAHIVRRRTIGRAQALFNDLTANAANYKDYTDIGEFTRDGELLELLTSWLSLEKTLEA